MSNPFENRTESIPPDTALQLMPKYKHPEHHGGLRITDTLYEGIPDKSRRRGIVGVATSPFNPRGNNPLKPGDTGVVVIKNKTLIVPPHQNGESGWGGNYYIPVLPTVDMCIHEFRSIIMDIPPCTKIVMEVDSERRRACAVINTAIHVLREAIRNVTESNYREGGIVRGDKTDQGFQGTWILLESKAGTKRSHLTIEESLNQKIQEEFNRMTEQSEPITARRIYRKVGVIGDRDWLTHIYAGTQELRSATFPIASNINEVREKISVTSVRSEGRPSTSDRNHEGKLFVTFTLDQSLPPDIRR